MPYHYLTNQMMIVIREFRQSWSDLNKMNYFDFFNLFDTAKEIIETRNEAEKEAMNSNSYK